MAKWQGVVVNTESGVENVGRMSENQTVGCGQTGGRSGAAGIEEKWPKYPAQGGGGPMCGNTCGRLCGPEGAQRPEDEGGT